jgi:hypothetical protein
LDHRSDPALGFLVMVKIALAQTPEVSSTSGSELHLLEVCADDSPSGNAVSAMPPAAGVVRTVEAGAVELLMPVAWAAAEVLDRDGERVSRQALAGALRADGHAVSNALASALLRALKAEAETEEGQLDPAVLRRRFGPASHGPRSVSAAR